MNEENFKKIYGWDNQETYQIVLYLQNDLYPLTQELKKESKNWMEFSDKIKNVFEQVKMEAFNCPIKETIQLLLHIGSLHRVNWDEIAKSLYSDK